jgi:hypothetical protein
VQEAHVLELLTGLPLLIDRLVALVKRREEVNRAIYTDFIVPIFKDFEALHNNYITTFADYRESLVNTAVPLSQGHPVFAQIRADSLFSQHLRAKFPRADVIENSDRYVRAICWSVIAYLNAVQTDHEPPPVSRPSDNLPRDTLAYHLHTILSSPNSTQEALDVLDRVVEGLQRAHEDVVRLHIALRRELLLPRTIGT